MIKALQLFEFTNFSKCLVLERFAVLVPWLRMVLQLGQILILLSNFTVIYLKSCAECSSLLLHREALSIKSDQTIQNSRSNTNV